MSKSWLITITFTFCTTILFKWLFSTLVLSKTKHAKKHLPPGPLAVPLIGSLLWLRHSYFDLSTVLRDLKLKYGPIITLKAGPRPAIFVCSHSLAYRALVDKGAIFSDRPQGLVTSKILHSSQLNVSLSTYGPTWRILRRNLTSQLLHSSCIGSYSKARKSVLQMLIRRLFQESDLGVKVIDHFQYAMFSLLALMCLGNNLGESQIKEIETVQTRLILGHRRFVALNLFPTLGRFFFRNRWKEMIQWRQDQEKVLIPIIEARISSAKQGKDGHGVVAYVDTLVDLELPHQKRKLNIGELVTLCGEFLNAGTDSTATALQWIMANLVKYPHIQVKLYEEILGVVGLPPSGCLERAETVVKEEDLQKMPYLKAVLLEGLRRHPPGHFVLPHSVTEEVELGGYMIPKNAIVNFMVADMGWDPNVWEKPMEFNPERFLSNGKQVFDTTNTKEIKMMPFGAGRRMCPGSALALLHLEYFVANLVWYFEWKVMDGADVDLTEKQEFTVVLKDPLRVRLCPRAKLNSIH